MKINQMAYAAGAARLALHALAPISARPSGGATSTRIPAFLSDSAPPGTWST